MDLMKNNKIFRITEEQYKAYVYGYDLYEGVKYTNNGDGSINMSMNSKMTDKDNLGKYSIDTRMFGTKNDILHGDGTAHGKTKSLSTKYNDQQAVMKLYQDVINFIKNGRKGNIDTSNVPQETVKAMNDAFNTKSDEQIVQWAQQMIHKRGVDTMVTASKYNRVNNIQNDDKIARYNTGVVPGTNVKFIALFSMQDFNFSDAIKHGSLRQSDYTNKLMGINDNGQKGKPIPLTYDNKYTPNIAGNFSLNNVQDGHYKQQYGYQGEGGYSSVAQFMDKSVMYAKYALEQESYKPDYIVACPSSSKFNEYFCINLSRKLGVEYIKDFFQRNIVNVKFRNGDEQSMLNDGFNYEDIEKFKTKVKSAAYSEIAYFISQPITNFVNTYAQYFSNISAQKHSREKAQLKDVTDCLLNYTYNSIVNSNDVLEKHLIKNFLSQSYKLNTSKYNSEHIFNDVSNVIKLKIGQRVFNKVLIETKNIINQYIEALKTNGYALRFDVKRFKIVKFDKRERKYLHNVYIIADEMLNENGQLFTRYQNAKFLIYDEDINSGSTLKLVIDALEEKLPEHNEQNIIGLTNAYANKGN